MCFYETVDNFVDKSLRVPDVAKKSIWNRMLRNRGPVAH
jgi:hypothetical protein